MGTTTTGAPGPTTTNPYGISPQLQAFANSIGALGNTIGSTMPNSANYMRPAPPPSWTPGVPNNLLATILQMRQAQAQSQAYPYQQGVALPRVSLLSG